MIKYRVWDNTEQKYDYDGYSIGCDGKLYKSGGVVELAKDYIIEQYTGLKDKNGVEIYEGDILGLYEIYIEEDETESEELEPWGEVVRTAAAMMVKSVRGGVLVDIVDSGEDSSEPMAGVEVMGNVHENAELLEEKQ